MQKPENPNDFGELTEEEDIYKENILDHYKHPHNTGSLKEYSFKHKELNPLCGDTIEMFVLFENEKVKHVSFIGHGCAISQASASMLTDYIKNKDLEEVKNIKRDVILEMLGIKIGVVRMKCALLSLRTLSKGVDKLSGTHNKDNIGLCR
ncbi:MAG: SUF system NifU family Fe-S cluster assembly protein [Candidatus Aenigmarchaeota archaeon]|nr:SUF system NifU family Fe-S cluster assembly protein [Candidatus Aenigmarchaeota archaeon]